LVFYLTAYNTVGDQAVQQLIAELRTHAVVLYKICEGIAMLDMLSAFAQLVTSQDYGLNDVESYVMDTLMLDQFGLSLMRRWRYKVAAILSRRRSKRQNTFQMMFMPHSRLDSRSLQVLMFPWQLYDNADLT